MAVSIEKARDFVYSSGTLWERALFGYLFEGRPLARVHQCLTCYKNPDGGFGHGIEHDIKTPDSHPLALEYLLSVVARDLELPPGDLFQGTAEWVEKQRKPDGSLDNPASVRTYPHAPWWAESGGQTAPDSITGNLTKLGFCTPSLADSTRLWVREHLTLNAIARNEWLFMAYHAFDYFMNVDDFPDVETYRQAVIQNIAGCAEKAPEKQWFVLFQFAPTPDSSVAKAMPHLIKRNLDYVASTQRDDGGWEDEHGLPHWQPIFTITVLRALQRYGVIE